VEKTVVLCIGNRDGGDDAIGPFIADKLKDYNSEELICIDAGIAPENFTDVVKGHHPERLIIVDAIEMNINAGEIRRVAPEKIGLMHISTHGIPLSVLIKYFNQYVKNIMLIGIQPSQMQGFLTDVIKQAGDKFIQLIISDSLEKISRLF
jgi:hydrogenase 3 maturation protease